MKNYGQKGVASDLQFGKDGVRQISINDTLINVRNKDNTAFANVAVAPATADDHAVTFKQLKTLVDVKVVGQIDGGNAPTVVNSQVYICTTTGTTGGTTFTSGLLYYGVDDAWVFTANHHAADVLSRRRTCRCRYPGVAAVVADEDVAILRANHEHTQINTVDAGGRIGNEVGVTGNGGAGSPTVTAAQDGQGFPVTDDEHVITQAQHCIGPVYRPLCV